MALLIPISEHHLLLKKQIFFHVSNKDHMDLIAAIISFFVSGNIPTILVILTDLVDIYFFIFNIFGMLVLLSLSVSPA